MSPALTEAPAAAPLPPALLPVAAWMRVIPDALHTRALCALTNLVLAPYRDRLAALDGKRVAVELSDVRARWCVVVRDGRLLPAAAGADAHVRIRGSLADLLRLAARTEDPDTLFFNRRLALEGETETGLLVKNLLDAVEPDWEGALGRLLGPGAATPLADMARRSGAERTLRRAVERLLA